MKISSNSKMTAPAMTPVHATLVRVLRVARSSGRRARGPEVGAAVSPSGGFTFGSRDPERGVRSGSVLSTLPDLPRAGSAQLLSGTPLAGNQGREPSAAARSSTAAARPRPGGLAQLDGDLLTLSTKPMMFQGVEPSAHVVWERVGHDCRR